MRWGKDVEVDTKTKENPNTISGVNLKTKTNHISKQLTESQSVKLSALSQIISDGADVFLFQEYMYLAVFVIFFGTLIFLYAEAVPGTGFTTIAFATGAITSILCGYIGMKIATKANARTCFRSFFGLGHAFKVAYQGGCVLGFVLVSINLFSLLMLIIGFKSNHFFPY